MRQRIIKVQHTQVKNYPKKKKWYAGSPYWDYLFNKQNASLNPFSRESGAEEIQEPQQSNPDVLSDEQSIYGAFWAPKYGSKQTEIFSSTNWKKELTKQQYRVLCKMMELIKKGKDKRLTQDIGAALGISHQGVSNHIKLIRKKMEKIIFPD